MKNIFIIISLLFLLSCWKEKEITYFEDKNKIIISLWDSLTEGYWVKEEENYPYKLQKLLNENGYNYEVINWWISWDTSYDLRQRAEKYIEQNPEVVIIAIWANDWLRWKSIEKMKTNIIEVIDLFLENNTKVILSGMDTPITYWFWYRSDFKEAYKDIKTQKDDIFFHKYFLKWVALKTKYNISDNIHPNWLGYDIISKNIYDFIIENKIIKNTK